MVDLLIPHGKTLYVHLVFTNASRVAGQVSRSGIAGS